MKRSVRPTRPEMSERESLRRRVKQFYRRFNSADWGNCYALVDPRLTRQGKPELDSYSRLMQAFKRLVENPLAMLA